MNALTWIQERKQEGINVFITGPYNTLICASDSYVNLNGLTMIGTPGFGFCPSHNRVDNIFRVSPNQRENTLAVSKLLEKDGVKALIVVQQDDGTAERIDGFVDEIIGATAGLEEHRVVEVGFNEAPMESYVEEDWRMSEELMNRVSDALDELMQSYPREKIGVLYASFTPNPRHIVAADRHSELVDVTWYSTTYFTQHGVEWGSFVGNHTSRLQVLAPEAYLNLGENPTYLKLEERYEGTSMYGLNKIKLGEAEASMYDAVWLGALSVIEANSTDADSLRSVFIQVANSYTGATGRVRLDQNGDRFKVDQLIYGYQLVDGVLESRALYRFDADTGVIIDH